MKTPPFRNWFGSVQTSRGKTVRNQRDKKAVQPQVELLEARQLLSSMPTRLDGLIAELGTDLDDPLGLMRGNVANLQCLPHGDAGVSATPGGGGGSASSALLGRCETPEGEALRVGATTHLTGVKAALGSLSAASQLMNLTSGYQSQKQAIPGALARTGQVTLQDGFARFQEDASSLTASLQKTFIVPGQARRLSFDVTSLELESSASGLPDAFEVSLLNDQNQSLVTTFSPRATAFLNFGPGGQAAAAPGVTFDGRRVTLDLTSLKAGTKATLVFDLVGNRPGLGSQAAVANVLVGERPLLTGHGPSPTFSPGASTLPEPERTDPLGPVDLSRFEDVTGLGTLQFSGTTLNRQTGTLFADVRVTNQGNFPMQGPVLATFRSLTPSVGIGVVDDVLPDGRPAVAFNTELNGRYLEPGQTSGAETVGFAVPGMTRFDFSTSVLAPRNESPTFIAQPVTQAVSDEGYQYTASATDPNGDPLTYRLLQAPAGMTLDAQSGALSWTPAAGEAGTHPVSVQVADNRGGTATQSFTLLVLPGPGNHNPVFVTAPVNPAALAGQTFTYAAEARDPDGDGITYSLLAGPDGMTVAPDTGLLSWAAGADQLGDHTVSVRATDGRGGAALQTFTVTATGGPAASLSGSVFDDINNDRSQDVASVTLFADDFTAGPSPQWGNEVGAWSAVDGAYRSAAPSNNPMTYTSLGLSLRDFTLDLDVNQVRDGGIWLRSPEYNRGILLVTGGFGGTGNGLYWHIFDGVSPIVPINPAFNLFTPGVETAHVRVVVQGDNYAAYVNGSTTPATTLTTSAFSEGRVALYSFSNQSFDNINISSAVREPGQSGRTVFLDQNGNGRRDTGESSATTDADGGYSFAGLAPGAYRVVQQLPPGRAASTPANATHAVTLAGGQTVGGLAFGDRVHGGADANQPPAFTSSAPASAAVGQVYQYQAAASDPDGDPLTFDLVSGPAGLVVDPTSGLVLWTPTVDQAGSQSAVLRARDGQGGEVLQTITVTVDSAGPSLLVTSVPPALATQGEDASYTATSEDPVGAEPTFVLLSGPSAMSLDAAGRLNWTPAAGDLGPRSVSLAAVDAAGRVAFQSFVINVRGPNQAPVISSSPASTAVVDAAYRYAVRASDSADAISYRLARAPAEMSIDPLTGLISWQPTAADVGTHTVDVQVTDERGAVVDQVFGLMVAPDTNAPGVEVLVSTNLTSVGQAVDFQVLSADDVGVVARSATVNGKPVALDTHGQGTFRPTAAGIYTVVGKAADAAGNITTARSVVLVLKGNKKD